MGNPTRLALVATLCGGPPRSIAQLTGDTRLTRQAVSKHLRALAGAGIVHSARAGRENRFAFDPTPLDELRNYLDLVSQRWDEALDRLKAAVDG